MAKPDTSAYQTFDQITDRLDDIVSQVRNKDVSLEHSLDLFDEAIALGSKAVDMVDTTEFTAEEEARLADVHTDSQDGEPTEPAVSDTPQAVADTPQAVSESAEA